MISYPKLLINQCGFKLFSANASLFPFVENFVPLAECGVMQIRFSVFLQMKWLKMLLPADRLGWAELVFFLIYFLVFRLLTAVEYSLAETHGWQHFRLYFLPIAWNGLLDIIPFWLCYRWMILGLLFRRRYIVFAICFLLFICLLNGWHTFFNNLARNSSFKHALGQVVRWQTIFYVSLVYMLRELLVLLALAYFVRSARLESQHTASELEQLKAQLQPHFFFNTLNTIYAFAQEGSKLTAPLIAGHADVMRYILYRAQAPRVPLIDEINFISSYIAAEELRYGDRINVSLEVQGLAGVSIEPLLLFPFVENAFKHGISDEQNQGFLDIVVVVLGTELTFLVRNSRPKISRTGGIGLINVRKRLEILYPGTHRLEIKEEPACWTVELCVKLHRV